MWYCKTDDELFECYRTVLFSAHITNYTYIASYNSKFSKGPGTKSTTNVD